MRSSAAAVLRGASCCRTRCSSSSSTTALAARLTVCSRHRSTSSVTLNRRAASTPSSPSFQRSVSQSLPRRRHAADTSEPAASTTTTSSTVPETHYDLFPSTLPDGPPPKGHFPVDARALRREFLRLQARAHPDMHPAGAAKTRAEALSARINEAYKTLANPLLRAQYLLSLRGVDVANDERLKVDEPDLLMVVLEAREEIEEADTEADLESIREENEERIAKGEEALERAFREDDVEAAKREAVRMRYWVNIRESLDNWEPGKPIVLEH
ncbi:hypothetical protein PWT90_09771 [Aphanocladium album]|nr:hypothetical protein PWT90_09771 [Aphanocladium album]